MSLRRLSIKGFTLALFLMFLMGLAILAVMVMGQGQSVRTLVLGSGRHFAEVQTSLDAEGRLSYQLSDWAAAGAPPASSTRYQPEGGDTEAVIYWKKGSRFDPPPRTFASFSNLFPNWKKDPFTPGSLSKAGWPRAGYVNSTEQGRASVNGVPVPVQHTVASVRIADKTRTVVYSPHFPYTVYAPSGTIQLEQALSYNNLPYRIDSEGRELEVEQFNGRPIKMFANHEIDVGLVEIAELESRTGPIMVEEGPAISRVRASSEHSYPAQLQLELKTVMDDLGRRGFDKTGFFVGRPLTPSGLWNVFTGQSDWYSFLSLEQAMQLPFFIFPSWKNYEVGLVFCFHVPLPSDWPGYDGGHDQAVKIDLARKEFGTAKKKAAESKKDLDRAQREYDKAKAKVKSLEREKEPDEKALKKARKDQKKKKSALSKAKSAYDESARESADAKKALDGAIHEAKVHLDNIGSAVLGVPPQTSLQEADYERRRGRDGWSYARLGLNVASNLSELIATFVRGKVTIIPDKIAQQFVFPSRVVHFASRRPRLWSARTTELRSDLFTFDRPAHAPLNYNSFTATWSIQPGTSSKLRGDWQIVGDLWIRRGGLLVVEGDLALTRPPTWPATDMVAVGDFLNLEYLDKEETSLMRPSGRIILEEGASLVITGNLTADGSSELGSVTATAAYDDPSMINRAILCGGDVKLKHGIHSGILMDDFLPLLDKFGKDNYGLWNQLMNKVVPLIARLPFVSPFGSRPSYFAKYATTIEYFPESEALELPPLILPIPLPYENCQANIFDFVSFAYSTHLGFQLGPKFITHASFWPWGNGVVPVVPKVSVAPLKAALKDFHPPSTLMASLTNLDIPAILDQLAQELTGTIITTVISESITRILGDTVSFSCLSSGKKGEPSKYKIKRIVTKVFEKLGFLWKVKGEVTAWLKFAYSHLSAAKFAASNAWKEELSKGVPTLNELPGVLVYANGSLQVGSTISSGWLVARDDLVVESDIFLGTLMSLEGSVTAKTVYGFPYYSLASLYRPSEERQRAWEETFLVHIPKGKETPLTIGRPIYHRTARVWGGK